MSKKVAIVGAGLAGLACASELKKKGCQVKIFEASASVGGRVKTDELDGFLLDHGFQVYLPSYEKGEYFFDHSKLNLKKFAQGAHLKQKNGFELIADPFKNPSLFFKVLSSKHLSFKDKLLTLKLKKSKLEENALFSGQQSTLEFLEEKGFSKNAIDAFFKPFFSGVFLDEDLSVSKNYFLYLYGKFSEAAANLPQRGMRALPEQLASSFSEEELSLSNSVISIGRGGSVISEKGAVESFDKVVLAVSADLVTRFVNMDPGFKSSSFSVSTYYYKTSSNKLASKFLYLTRGKYVNHVACLSAVQKSYAPKGQHLFSVNVVGNRKIDSRFITDDLQKIFGEEEIKNWEYMKAYHISKALPKHPFYGQMKNPQSGIFVAGDFTESPSIQGALLSGYKTAELVVKG